MCSSFLSRWPQTPPPQHSPLKQLAPRCSTPLPRLARTPEARIQIRVDDVALLAEPLARVRGLIQYTEKPGAKTVESRFDSLRVLENGRWRLVRSAVEPSHAAALDDLGWL